MNKKKNESQHLNVNYVEKKIFLKFILLAQEIELKEKIKK